MKDVDIEQFVRDAVRTDSTDNYAAAIRRLQDPRVVRLLHVGVGLATEAGEYLGQIKKHIFYGTRLDTTNLMEELGDTSWYQRIGLDELQVRLVEMLERNVAKLKIRFPDKFTEEAAMNRDLDAERKTLEDYKAVSALASEIPAGTYLWKGEAKPASEGSRSSSGAPWEPRWLGAAGSIVRPGTSTQPRVELLPCEPGPRPAPDMVRISFSPGFTVEFERGNVVAEKAARETWEGIRLRSEESAPKQPEGIIDKIAALDSDDREAIFDIIRDRWCIHCGGETPELSSCTCQRDD